MVPFWRTLRYVVAGLCAFAVLLLSPGVLVVQDTPFWYESLGADSFGVRIQGAEWALLGLLIFVLSFLGFHCLFWDTLFRDRPLNRFVSRDLFNRLVDYIWLLAGLASLLFLLLGLNAREASRYQALDEARREALRPELIDAVKRRDVPCGVLRTAADDPPDKADRPFWLGLCEGLSDERPDTVRRACSGYDERGRRGGDGPAFRGSPDRPDEVAGALDELYRLCAVSDRFDHLGDRIASYEAASNKYYENEEKNDPVWFVLFPIVIAFRMMKTSAEVFDAWRGP